MARSAHDALIIQEMVESGLPVSATGLSTEDLSFPNTSIVSDTDVTWSGNVEHSTYTGTSPVTVTEITFLRDDGSLIPWVTLPANDSVTLEENFTLRITGFVCFTEIQ